MLTFVFPAGLVRDLLKTQNIRVSLSPITIKPAPAFTHIACDSTSSAEERQPPPAAAAATRRLKTWTEHLKYVRLACTFELALTIFTKDTVVVGNLKMEDCVEIIFEELVLNSCLRPDPTVLNLIFSILF